MVNDRFIRLVTMELCDQLTDAEREELKRLLQEVPGYREQRDILKEYWAKDRAEYRANAAMFRTVMEKIRAEEPAPRPRRISPMVWSSVAAVALIVTGLYLFRSFKRPYSNETIAITWRHTTTPATKKSIITFSDGSVVTLNSATTLQYPDHFSDFNREVYLEGEAYFDVAKDPLHPFIIHTNRMNIRVLGTSFNVKSYPGERSSEATLIKGSIEVTLNDRPSDRIILKPKEKLIVQNNTAIKRLTSPVAVQLPPDSALKGTRYSLTNLTYFRNNDKTVVETSWVENKLVFSDKVFSDLSGQLERWYGLPFRFSNEKLKGYRFTGLFEKETLPEALDALKMIEPFKYRITDTLVYIY